MNATPHKARDPLLAKIHIARKQLGMEDDDYRELLARVAGKRSSKDLSPDQREAVLAEFRRLGWRDRRPARSGRERDVPTHRGTRTLHAKARALWWSLYWLGETDRHDAAALDAFARRTGGVDYLVWADAAAANRIVEGLKAWCARAGFAPDPAMKDQYRAARREAKLDPRMPPGFSERVELIRALWDKLIAAGALDAGVRADLGTWLKRQGFGVAAPWFLTDGQTHAAIEALGKWYRRIIGKEP